MSSRSRAIDHRSPIKKLSKQEREREVLFGLIEYYIETGKPVGSNTLKEVGFEGLSSATIRNYFASLEQAGLLIQSHASGGRIPTSTAYSLYAEYCLGQTHTHEPPLSMFESLESFDSKEVPLLIEQAAELLASSSRCAVFLSAPRFDQDFISDIKITPIDATRCLCVLISNFGAVKTELMPIPYKLTLFTLKRLENYFHWRLTGVGEQPLLNTEEENLGKNLYNELLLRYIICYSHFSHSDIYRTGFSQLLKYPELQGIAELAQSLALFEDVQNMRHILRSCQSRNSLFFTIGNSTTSSSIFPHCSVLAAPYAVGPHTVGAVGLLGPNRLPYRDLFLLLKAFASQLSRALTRNIYKFKLTFRDAKPSTQDNKLQLPRFDPSDCLCLPEHFLSN